MVKSFIRFLTICLLCNLFIMPISALYTPSTAMKCALDRVDQGVYLNITEINVSDCNLNKDELNNYFWDGASGHHFRELIASFKYSYKGTNVEDLILNYRYSKSSITSLIKIFENKVVDLVNKIKQDSTMSELDILFYLHNYLALNTAYDKAAATDPENFKNPDYALSFSMFGPIVYNKAVCSGYSQAYMNILNRLGYEAYYLTSNSMNHGWNVVKYLNNYYHIDITYDDPTPDRLGNAKYDYFMVNDEEISIDHQWEDHSVKIQSTDLQAPNYIFNQGIKDAYYRNGYWYYILNNVIYKSKIDGRETSIVYDGAKVLAMAMNEDMIFYTTTTNGYYVNEIYVINVNNIKPILLSIPKSSTYIGYLHLKDNKLFLSNRNMEVHKLELSNKGTLNSYLQNITITDDDYIYGEIDLAYKYFSSLTEINGDIAVVLKPKSYNTNSTTAINDIITIRADKLSSTLYSFTIPLESLTKRQYTLFIKYKDIEYPLTGNMSQVSEFTNINNYTIGINKDILTLMNNIESGFDYSPYGNGQLSIYENSRVTYTKFYGNYLSIDGYCFEKDASFSKKASYVRELVLVEMNTNAQYRIGLDGTYNPYLNANVNLNPDGSKNYDYAYYKTIVDFNKVYTYWDKTMVSLPSGEYRAFIRLSDGVRSNVIPLRNLHSDTSLSSEFHAIDNSNDLAFTYTALN